MSITAKVVEYLKSADLSRARMHAVGLPMSNQTLRRRLIAEGTSFPALVEAEKKRRCVEAMATNPGISGKKVTTLCGFSDHSSFYRAFQKWFGQTYSECKRSIQC